MSTLELLVEIVDREGAVDADRTLVDPLQRLVREVVLVLDLADDLLEDVLQGHDALHRAVLVDHERHVLVLRPELREQRGEILRLRHEVGLAEEILDHDVVDAPLVERREQVADVEDSDDLVDGLAVGGIPRVRRRDHGGKALPRRECDRDRHHLGAMNHHVVNFLVGELEGGVAGPPARRPRRRRSRRPPRRTP